MAAAMPAAELRVVSGAGHTVHLERPAVWLDEVTRFLHG
jgi:pimeloyl-ACP methyl ester carboxylesterase